jgi:hypothetical protein
MKVVTEKGERVPSYVYHRPDVDVSNPVPKGDWLQHLKWFSTQQVSSMEESQKEMCLQCYDHWLEPCFQFSLMNWAPIDRWRDFVYTDEVVN